MRVKLDAGRLKGEIARRGLDGQQFARVAGISAGTLSNALNGKAVNPLTLRRISIALAKTLVVDDAGLVREESA